MSLRDESRKEWDARADRASCEEIKVGALQRLADATEILARDRVAMEAEIGRLRRSVDYWQARCETAERSRSALRGAVTRLKGRIADLKEPRHD